MENEKHFKLLKDDSIEIDGVKLYRIEATKDLPQHNVEKGEKGGYVEKEYNLMDNAWIGGNAKVYGNAKVFENARVYGNAEIFENAKVFGNALIFNEARIYGNAQVYGNSMVGDNVKVFEDAVIYENAYVHKNAKVFGCAVLFGASRVYGNAVVFGETRIGGNAAVYEYATVYEKARIGGNALIFGNACVCGDAKINNFVYLSERADIKSNDDFCFFSGFGSERRDTTFFKTRYKEIFVVCGCFRGTLEEFVRRVKETHKNGKYAKEYLAIVEVVKIRFGLP